MKQNDKKLERNAHESLPKAIFIIFEVNSDLLHLYTKKICFPLEENNSNRFLFYSNGPPVNLKLPIFLNLYLLIS